MEKTIFELKDDNLWVEGVKQEFKGIRFIELLGEGANAAVFLVDNSFPNRKEAIKVWYNVRKDGKHINDIKFQKEVQKNATLNIKNTPVIYEAGKNEIIRWCRMEYVPGKTLKTILKEAELDPVIRIQYAEKILRIVKQGLEAGVYHGDLHLNNVIIHAHTNEVYVMDYGTSCLSGKDFSHRRDARLIYSSIMELVPEIKRIYFLDDIIKGQDSSFVTIVLLISLNMIMGIIMNDGKELDDYGKKSLIMTISTMRDELKENGYEFRFSDAKLSRFLNDMKIDRKSFDFYFSISER